MSHRVLCALLTLVFLSPILPASEWPCWRGPHGDGTCDEKGIPTRWSSKHNIAWKVAIPGKGHSSPVIWEDRVFITTCVENDQKRLLLCLDRRDGKLLWQSEVVAAPLEKKHKLNSFASSTPATDGKHIWVSFLDNHDMMVACYDIDGKQVWKKSPGKFYSIHGFCSSPVLYKDLVILNGDQDAVAYIVALDKATGAERWRADRPNKTRSYCTPTIIEGAGKKQLVLSGSLCVASYDPDTGKQLWIVDGPTQQFVAGLVYADNIVFLTAGFPEFHLMGIRPDGSGNVTKTHVAWHEKTGPSGAAYVPSPVAHDKYFFVVSDTGMASCLDAKTGKHLWTERLGRHHSASPVCADGHLYFLDDDGKMFVLKAGPKFELVSKNLLEEECYASPAVSRGQLFIRGLQHLYCIGTPEK